VMRVYAAALIANARMKKRNRYFFKASSGPEKV
jgi:hypothetical protein